MSISRKNGRNRLYRAKKNKDIIRCQIRECDGRFSSDFIIGVPTKSFYSTTFNDWLIYVRQPDGNDAADVYKYLVWNNLRRG